MAAVGQLVAVPGRRPSGVASRVYRRLLADILTGALPPGSELKLLSLAERYETSRASVRQSVLQLAVERLVVPVAPQGYRVAPASADDLLDLIKTLGWLTAIGIRESILNGDRHWEDDVLGAHRGLAQCFDQRGRLRRGRSLRRRTRARISRGFDIGVPVRKPHRLLPTPQPPRAALSEISPRLATIGEELRVGAASSQCRTRERMPRLALELFDAHYRFVVQRVLASGVLS